MPKLNGDHIEYDTKTVTAIGLAGLALSASTSCLVTPLINGDFDIFASESSLFPVIFMSSMILFGLKQNLPETHPVSKFLTSAWGGRSSQHLEAAPVSEGLDFKA